MKLSSTQPHRRLSFLRRPLRALPLLLLNGAWAQAQSTGTQTAAQAAPSGLASLISGLGALSMLALLVGAVRPKTFAFLFKEKTTRKRVCWTFGAAMLACIVVSGSMAPRREANVLTQSAPSVAVPGKPQDAVRLAESRAKAAEARAERAEKAAASANANAKSNTNASAKRREALRAQVKRDLGIPDSLSQSQSSAPKSEPLADNVSVVNIEGVGKREMGVVDEVVYGIVRAQTTKMLGPEMYRREADGVFYVLQVVSNNTAEKTHNVTTRIMKLVDEEEREFDPSSEGGMALSMAGEQSAEPFSAQLQPGVAKRFTLVFDAPADAKGLKLKIPAGSFSFGKDALIKVPTASE